MTLNKTIIFISHNLTIAQKRDKKEDNTLYKKNESPVRRYNVQKLYKGLVLDIYLKSL